MRRAPGGAPAVVMLGGGSINVQTGGHRLTSINRFSALRAIEAARVYRLLGDPLVIVSGGATTAAGAPPESDAYQTAMRSLGVPPERVVSESESLNTHDEAGDPQTHAPRPPYRALRPGHLAAAHAALARGVCRAGPVSDAVASGARSDQVYAPMLLLPSDGAFDVGNAVVYEWIARAYYWAQGWTRPPAAAR